MKKLQCIIGIILIFLVLTNGGMSARSSRMARTDRAEAVPLGLSPIAETPQGASVIEPELLRALLKAKPDEYLRIIIRLNQQTDLSAVAGPATRQVEARTQVVSTLQATANRTQADLLTYLEKGKVSGQVESYTSFWIFNGFAVCAKPAFVRALASHPAVSMVQLDHWRQWIATSPDNSSSSGALSRSLASVEWGIERIQAPKVWSSFHISGTGAVVAGMDTGVDWLHPALRVNYRGYNPHGPANHVYSWYDATNVGALYPVDGHGHGSHTMGTMVGRDGIGVAPGARWISVRVLNSQGQGYDSWIHKGFQWLLAPGGDPTRAPDMVNNSWGNNLSYLTTFRPDLRVLRAAGILAVFANGNEGPSSGTVNSPASLPEAFAVGAIDRDDEVANFSSRGPSPWEEIRPHVVAPGVSVRSSLPGGAYGELNGTSMAAPHVSGVVALLRSVSPTLSVTRTAHILTSTAVPMGDLIPNNNAGWGRVDAFAAMGALVNVGFISGTVTRADDGAPIASATIQAMPHGPQGSGRTTSDENGGYLLALLPTAYDLTASAFGYEPATAAGIAVVTGTTIVQDFSLAPYPTGVLKGHVTDAVTGVPVTATVELLNAPRVTTASAYTFTLPAGTYTLRARSVGHRVVTATATVIAGQATVVDLALPPAPSILLVDSGSWYYRSQIQYFSQALDDLAYAYDEWTIKHLLDDLPTPVDLSPYDVVIWSAPEDAPGYIGAENTIVSYLSSGGRLFLSGQDIGLWDGGGVLGYWSAYYRNYLKARYVRDDAPARVLEGVGEEIFAGLTLTITGPGGADNQGFPDAIDVTDSDAASKVLIYQGGGCGGIRVGTCLDYRVVYLSFGFEAINTSHIRREVMRRSLDWLTAPLPTVGLELKPVDQMQVGQPGTQVTHTLTVRHVGQGGVTDTIDLALIGASWETKISSSSLALTPCSSARVSVTVTVPLTAGWNVQDVVTVSVRSALSPTLIQTATLVTKAPAPVLLVDDDRWHNQEAKYEAALASNDFPYDYWRTGWSSRELSWGSPSADALQRYPIVIWFTGNDWYEPVTEEEVDALTTYLNGGGRLFLSSQDFLYYHYGDPFIKEYLGVMDYTEDITPTLATGVPEDLIGDRLGPYLLDYPFQNWSDAVTPAPGVAVSFREQDRHPIALAHHDATRKAAFLSFPFETLPEEERAGVLERLVGWLNWLGNSTFTVSPGAASAGDTLTYTLVLCNDGPETVGASFSNTLPSSVTLIPASLIGPATYYTPTGQISWVGAITPMETITFTYQAIVATDTGTLVGHSIVNTAHIALDDHHILFSRSAAVRIGTPDLSPSTFGCVPSPVRPGAVVTCALTLINTGPADAEVEVLNLLPEDAMLVPDSVSYPGAGTLELPTGTVQWTGPLIADAIITLTYQVNLPTNPVHLPLYNVAFLEDDVGGTWERSTWILIEPLRIYLPLLFKGGL